jgi:Na+(H+)/acetate symporter ActP
MSKDAKIDVAIGFGAVLMFAVAVLLGGCARDTQLVVAKKTILSVGEATHAAEVSWKAFDQSHMLKLVMDAKTEPEALAAVSAWQTTVQPKVNKALGTIGTAAMTAKRTLGLVEAGLAKAIELLPLAKELYAQFQELRALLTQYNVAFQLPGGL